LLIARAALRRAETRGGHFRADFPAAQAPGRTLVTFGDIAAPALRFAAE
jgi:L-aspartate oxidase